jgi:hypothetical protein
MQDASRQPNSNLREIISETHFQDTHEHLPPEIRRIEDQKLGNLDFSYLFSHYLDSDLLSAGMPQNNFDRFFGNEEDSSEKWKFEKIDQKEEPCIISHKFHHCIFAK